MERRFAYMRPDQILDEFQRAPVAYLPIGPLEWHGPHLPFGVDPLNAENAASHASEQTGGIVFPTLYWGTERERSEEVLDWLGFAKDAWIVGMDFPANSLPSMYCSEEIFALILREQLRLIEKFGFKLAVCLSGHGAENHLLVLQRLSAEFNAAGKLKVLVCMPFVTNKEGIMEVGHASRIETGVIQALQPQTVDLDRLPGLPEPLNNVDWAIIDFDTFLGHPTPDRTIPTYDDPRNATPQEGRSTIECAITQIVKQVEEFMKQ